MNANKIIMPGISIFLSYVSVIILRAAMQMYKDRIALIAGSIHADFGIPK